MDRLVVGVDIGKSGGLCLFNPAYRKIMQIYDMPLAYVMVGNTKRSTFDIGGIYNLVSVLKDIGAELFVIEATGRRPGQGSGAAVTIGFGSGLLLMACHAVGVRFVEVASSTWKVKLRVPKDKTASVTRADQLFPDDYLRFRGKLGGIADGRAEAALIALYGAEEILGIKR